MNDLKVLAVVIRVFAANVLTQNGLPDLNTIKIGMLKRVVNEVKTMALL